MRNIVIFGPPGAGKGTQSKRLIEKYNLVYISTGDALRIEIASGSALGQKAKTLIDKGQLVPDKMVIDIVQHVIDTRQDMPDATGILFDGFPRTTFQAEALDEMLEAEGSEVSCMLSLDVPDKDLIERILIRAQISERSDDKEEIIAERLNEYKAKTCVVTEYYMQQGKYRKVDGTGTVDEITNRIFSIIDEYK